MKHPSPSLVLSIVAVVLAAAGTSVAAINYASNAGAVDGKSAVGVGKTRAQAAGKLVATGTSGALRGKLAARFLDLSGVVTGRKQKFAQGLEVADNASSTPVGLGGVPAVGTLSATCNDAAPAAGVEDPQVSISFANSSAQTVNYSRQVGRGAAEVSVVAAATQSGFTIEGSNVFRVYALAGTTHYVFEGVVRQDGANTAAGICTVYGYGLVL